MPASRLSEEKTPIRRSDVVGMNADQPDFVRHVALAAEDYEAVEAGAAVRVNHMGPPLESGKRLLIDAHGSAELDDDELSQIELFVDEHMLEQEAQDLRRFDRYVILPHADYYSEADGTPIFQRFSCAGYVVEAYREAGLDLIDGEAKLPDVELGVLFRVYRELERFENNEELRQRVGAPTREELGLIGPGPWPVLLPGYIFHALQRDGEAIRASPYTPEAGDGHFPRSMPREDN